MKGETIEGEKGETCKGVKGETSLIIDKNKNKYIIYNGFLSKETKNYKSEMSFQIFSL